MTQVTSAGFLRTRLDERLAELQEDFKAIYGNDIQIDPNSPDGQLIGVLADRFSDLDQLAEDVYNSFNPQLASGVSLSRLVQLNGIRRKAGSYSTCDVTFTGMPATVIPSGSQIKSTVDGSLWVTTADVTLDGTGQAVATLQAKEKGATAAAAGTLTKIDTPIFGWQTVTNANPAVVGAAEETDETLRIRRAGSTSTPGQGVVDALYGAIANLAGVRLARVYENYTDAVDANGQAPHSVYCIVEGGVAADIAQVIWKKRNAGATPIGTTVQTVYDVQGLPHDMKFSRPSYIDAYVTVNVTKRPGYPTDGAAQIKQALYNYGQNELKIGDPLLDTRLYTPVNTVKNHFITSINIGTAPNPAGAGNINCPFDGLIRIDQSRIVVNEA